MLCCMCSGFVSLSVSCCGSVSVSFSFRVSYMSGCCDSCIWIFSCITSWSLSGSCILSGMLLLV